MADADTGAQSGTGTDPTQSGGAGSEGSSGAASTGDGTQSGAAAGATTTTDDDKVSRTDFEAIQARMRAADQRAAKYEQELKALQTKDLPEAEKLKAEHAAMQQQVSQLAETNRKLTLENAFFKDNTHDWQNPGAALKMADLSQVTIGDDGTVTGLKDALKRLAAAEPWMLKPKSAASGGAAAGSTGAGTPGSTNAQSGGVPPMNGRPDTSAQSARSMATRLPALRSRQRPPTT